MGASHVIGCKLKGLRFDAATVRFGEIRAHYYRTHPSINPNGIVALQPAADFHAPHGRDG